MKEFFVALPALALILGVSACREEPDPGTDGPEANGSMIFNVGGIASSETKAVTNFNKAVQTDRIALCEPGEPDQVYLIETVEDMDSSFYNSALDTKGAPIYTETFANKYTSFSTVPYADGATSRYETVNSFSSVHLDKNLYAFDFPDDRWPLGPDGKTPTVDKFLFFMAAPANLTEVSNSALGYSGLTLSTTDGSIAFDYVAPGFSETAGCYTDPTLLNDLLFTSKSVEFSDYCKGATLLFYHTMAGVKFKSGNAVREGTEVKSEKTVARMTNITKITLTNILSNGHCVVTPDWSYSDSDSNVNLDKDGVDQGDVWKSSKATVWTWPDMEKLYRKYSVSVDGLVSNDGTTFPESTAFEGGNDLGQVNMNSDSFDKTFMFVPQTTSTEGGEVVITIEYTLNGKPYKKSVNFGERKWEAGKLYTYTLSANHVGVTISDSVNDQATVEGGDGKTKTFNFIKNTGNVNEYVRVAVVGNWYDSHSYYEKGQDQIVAPWSGIDKKKSGYVADSSEGEFNAEFAPSPWVDGGDGYWYFPYMVEPGTNVDIPLFDTFTAGNCPMELYGTEAHLEIDIIVQAIDAAWFADDTKKGKMTSYGWKMDKFQNAVYKEQ